MPIYVPKRFLRRQRGEERTRGQALVEFALLLPLLALMMVLALDFGRVFFGWVALNNAARIAANAAAANADAWVGTGNLADQAVYRQQVVNDLNAINCTPPAGSKWQTSDIPDPVFSNTTSSDTSSPYELGDQVNVQLTCHFTFLTPLVGNLLGNPLTISASSTFAVRTGEVAGIPVTATCSGAVVPYVVGSTVQAARNKWVAAGFLASNFSPAAGVADGSIVVTQQTSPVGNPGDCLVTTAAMTVTYDSSVTYCPMPLFRGEHVNTAQSDYTAAGFTGLFTINRPPSGNYTVTTQSITAGAYYPCSTSVNVGGS